MLSYYFETVAKLNALAEVMDSLAIICSLYHLQNMSIGFLEDVFILCRPLSSYDVSSCKNKIM